MRKLLLAAIIISFCLSANADEQQPPTNKPYVRMDIGINKFREFEDKSTNLELRSKNIFSFDIGTGCYLTDKIRGEIVYSHHFSPELKKSGADTNWQEFAQILSDYDMQTMGVYTSPHAIAQTLSENNKASVKHKAEIDTIMLKGYADVASFEKNTIFVGAGIGMARIKETISGQITFSGRPARVFRAAGLPTTDTWSDKAKKKNNITYSLSIGFSEQINPNSVIELQYTYSDFGKSGSYKTGGHELGENHYRSHAVKLGCRFSV